MRNKRYFPIKSMTRVQNFFLMCSVLGGTLSLICLIEIPRKLFLEPGIAHAESLVSEEEIVSPVLPSISGVIAPTEYLVAGPFLAGSREGMIDFLTDTGGEWNVEPEEGDELASWMVKGGMTKWRKLRADNGAIDAEFVDVDWEALQNHWGWAGGIYVAYAYTEVEVPERSRALAVAEHISSFQINGVPYIGDIYGHNFLRVPVELQAGKNRILIRFGRGDRIRFVFRLEPVPADLIALTNDLTYGNPVLGEPLDTYVAIPVVNTTNQTIRNGAIRLSWAVGDGSDLVATEKELPPIPPYGVYKQSIRVHSENKISESDLLNQGLPFKLELLHSGQIVSTSSVSLKAVPADQPRRVAFISKIDRSLQVFSVRFPENYDPAKQYALIVTLHGAGASDLGQVSSYTPKEWAFIIAPTNRRNFGFDWQDWGRLDALEVIEIALRNYPIDKDRVYLTGHSMGGHGTWHIGLKHADRFAAIAPSAGWTDFSLYVPPFTRRSLLFSSPALNAIWLAASAPDLFPRSAENGFNLKILSLVGEKDEQVPPVHLRMATDILRKAGADAALIEVPEQGHWFDFPDTPGTDCTDHRAIMDLFQATKNERNPRGVSFYSADLADSDGLYWVRVLEPITYGLPVSVRAEVETNNQIQVNTENVRALSLSPVGLDKGTLTIRIDGLTVTGFYDPGKTITLVRGTSDWQIGEWKEQAGRKSAHFSGPIKRAYFSPFIIVYADQGTAEETALFRQLAVMESFIWYWRGNGVTRVVPESRLFGARDSGLLPEKFNLIFYGTPQASPFIRKQFARMPFPLEITSDSLRMGGRKYLGRRLGLKMVYPLLDKERQTALVVYNTGTDAEAVREVARWTPLYSGSALPDFILTSPEALEKGWGGLLGAGFFDSRWLPDGPMVWFR